MQRAVGRAYQRLKGAHPRRPKSPYSGLLELACDLLLACAGAAVAGAVGVLIWGVVGGFAMWIGLASFGLAVLAAGLLLTWEKVAWEPFVERLTELS